MKINWNIVSFMGIAILLCSSIYYSTWIFRPPTNDWECQDKYKTNDVVFSKYTMDCIGVMTEADLIWFNETLDLPPIEVCVNVTRVVNVSETFDCYNGTHIYDLNGVLECYNSWCDEGAPPGCLENKFINLAYLGNESCVWWCSYYGGDCS